MLGRVVDAAASEPEACSANAWVPLASTHGATSSARKKFLAWLRSLDRVAVTFTRGTGSLRLARMIPNRNDARNFHAASQRRRKKIEQALAEEPARSMLRD